MSPWCTITQVFYLFNSMNKIVYSICLNCGEEAILGMFSWCIEEHSG